MFAIPLSLLNDQHFPFSGVFLFFLFLVLTRFRISGVSVLLSPLVLGLLFFH